ncbi:MAG: hypothetical protein LBT37_05925 [Lactobacillaceae bacterium]|jgi:hypothetical protein|nr:hypothetical protein [Lactobacillaceae bacterium]
MPLINSDVVFTVEKPPRTYKKYLLFGIGIVGVTMLGVGGTYAYQTHQQAQVGTALSDLQDSKTSYTHAKPAKKLAAAKDVLKERTSYEGVKK